MALDDMDAAFDLPQEVEDEKLRALYEVLIHRMRREAEHLPMNTVQQLLIERIAYNYVVLRSKERGQLGGFNHSGIQKDYNTFWLDMTREFNRMLGKTEGSLSAADRKALMKEMQKIILNTVMSAVTDPNSRSELLEKFAANFEAAGI